MAAGASAFGVQEGRGASAAATARVSAVATTWRRAASCASTMQPCWLWRVTWHPPATTTCSAFFRCVDRLARENRIGRCVPAAKQHSNRPNSWGRRPPARHAPTLGSRATLAGLTEPFLRQRLRGRASVIPQRWSKSVSFCGRNPTPIFRNLSFETPNIS